MTELQMSDVPRFRRERDRALLTGDVEEVYKFARRWYRNLPPRPDRATEETAMHLAIVRADTLPLHYRLRSREWLRKRGVTP